MSGAPLVEIDSVTMDAIYGTIMGLVQEAGKEVRKFIRQPKQVEEKLSRVDLVTQVDRNVEELLVNGIKAKYPDHEFIGEEGTAAQDGDIPQFSNQPTWIIDPIDGTMNFVHSNPNVGISVALAVNRRIEIGIIYLPIIEQLYTARRGQGAQYNGKPVKTSGCTDLSRALFVTEGGPGSRPKLDILANNMRSILEQCHAFRVAGSAAMDLAYVAAGQADAYVQQGIHCWDIAAGALIVKEAGGVVLDPSGGEFDFMSRRVLAASTEELAQSVIGMSLEEFEFPREFPDVCPL